MDRRSVVCLDGDKLHRPADLINTQKQTGRQLTVTINARHGDSARKLKELLLSGEIGEIYEANHDEFLDRSHGADYFRRWHAFRQNSGPPCFATKPRITWKVTHDAGIRGTEVDGTTAVIPIQAAQGEHGGADKRIAT